MEGVLVIGVGKEIEGVITVKETLHGLLSQIRKNGISLRKKANAKNVVQDLDCTLADLQTVVMAKYPAAAVKVKPLAPKDISAKSF